MHHDVDTEFQRTHQRWCAESIVDANPYAFGFGDLCKFCQIGNRQSWVADCFSPNQLCLVGYCGFDFLRVGHVNQSDFDAAAVADFVKQPIGTAIQIAPSQHVVPGGQHHHYAVDCGHPGGIRQRTTTAFERCERGLQVATSWVAAARIIEFAPLARSGLPKRTGKMDRWHDCARLRIDFVANVDGAGAEGTRRGLLWRITHALRACSKSAIRSSVFSIPQAIRIMLSSIPNVTRSSGVQ